MVHAFDSGMLQVQLERDLVFGMQGFNGNWDSRVVIGVILGL